MYFPNSPSTGSRTASARPSRGSYRQLADSDAEGMAFYEIRADKQSKEVDFAIWLADIGRYGRHVKGGQYRYEKGVLYLRTLDGEERKPSLLKQVKDSTMALHDYLKERIADKRCSRCNNG